MRWRRLSRREVVRTPVFALTERESEAPDGRRGTFTVLEAPDWAAVVPILPAGAQAGPGGAPLAAPAFLMVRQYRHGSDEVSLEFPGGVVEAGEDPAAAAARELEEETGWKAGRLRHAGTVSPNPAIMDNRFHVFVADRLGRTGRVSLDEHEIVEAFPVPVDEVRAGMGKGEYSHALMAAALLLAERLIAEE